MTEITINGKNIAETDTVLGRNQKVLTFEKMTDQEIKARNIPQLSKLAELLAVEKPNIDLVMVDDQVCVRKKTTVDEVKVHQEAVDFCQKNYISTLETVFVSDQSEPMIITKFQPLQEFQRMTFKTQDEVVDYFDRAGDVIVTAFGHGMLHHDIGFNIFVDQENNLLLHDFDGVTITNEPANLYSFGRALSELQLNFSRGIALSFGENSEESHKLISLMQERSQLLLISYANDNGLSLSDYQVIQKLRSNLAKDKPKDVTFSF